MIEQLKNIRPYIDFGFGITEKTIEAGQPVTVWLSTLYNTAEYDFSLDTAGEINKISDYEYEVIFTNPGEYELYLSVIPVSKKISLQSNVITLTVV